MIGVILAGGLSSRMGQDKAMLPFNGMNLLDHMLDLLEPLDCSEVYVSGNIEGYQCIKDSKNQLGPIGGLSAVLSRIPNDEEVLFIPVDMPCLTAGFLQKFKLNDYDAVASEESPLPLIIKNVPEIRDKISNQINNKRFSIRDFLLLVNTYYLPYARESEYFLQNANTPQQWKSMTL
jgi:molybdopterin-guanine dinucleotide biosynthesis protein A